jgi:Outer membrane protein beta-barrel domain
MVNRLSRLAVAAVATFAVLALASSAAWAQQSQVNLKDVTFSSARTPSATFVQAGNTQSQQQSTATGEKGFGFGVEGGFVHSSVRLTGITADTSGNSGGLVGIWFGGNRPGRIGVMGEVAYLVKGATDTGSGDQIKLHYLEIPILLRVNVGSHSVNGASGYVLAGPVIDLKLQAKLNGLDVGDQYNGVDLGVMAGAGFEMLRFGIEGRGNWGLRNIAKNLASTEKIKTFTFELLFKFRIN